MRKPWRRWKDAHSSTIKTFWTANPFPHPRRARGRDLRRCCVLPQPLLPRRAFGPFPLGRLVLAPCRRRLDAPIPWNDRGLFSHQLYGLHVRMFRGKQGQQGAVESRQLAVMVNRESQQVRIRHLSVTDDRDTENLEGLRISDIRRPEPVAPMVQVGTEYLKRLFRRDGAGGHRGIGNDSDESSLGERAGGPSLTTSVTKPLLGGFMKTMRRPSERDQQIDVEQIGFAAHRSSSQSRLTCSAVTAGNPGGGSNTSKPLAKRRVGQGAFIPRSSNSDTASPMGRARSAAYRFACLYTSSLRLSVVLIRP
jgi:hypothetical protein